MKKKIRKRQQSSCYTAITITTEASRGEHVLPLPQATPLLHHFLSSPLANSMFLELGTGPFQGPEGSCPQHCLLPFSRKCPSSSYQSIIANPPSRPPELSPLLAVFIACVTLPVCVLLFAVLVTRRHEKAQKVPSNGRRK